MEGGIESGEKDVDFSSLRKRLAPYLNLDRQHDLALIDHYRWGLVDLFQDRGIVDGVDGYERLLNDVSVSEETAVAVETFLKQYGKDMLRVVFNPGTISLRSYYERLFGGSGMVLEGEVFNNSRYLDKLNTTSLEPGISFVPHVNDFGATAVRACDPVTDWLLWRHRLDRSIRRLLSNLNLDGEAPLFPNHAEVAKWFALIGNDSSGVRRFPKWNDLSPQEYDRWCKLYLQAAGELHLPMMGADVYSKYPDFVHSESGVALATGVVSRYQPNEKLRYADVLSSREKVAVVGNSWVGTFVPEVFFVAQERQDPWVSTRLIF